MAEDVELSVVIRDFKSYTFREIRRSLENKTNIESRRKWLGVVKLFLSSGRSRLFWVVVGAKTRIVINEILG